MIKKSIVLAVLIGSIFFRLDCCKVALCLTSFSFEDEDCHVFFLELEGELAFARHFRLKDLKEKLKTSRIGIMHSKKPKEEILGCIGFAKDNYVDESKLRWFETENEYQLDGRLKKITLCEIKEGGDEAGNDFREELVSWDIYCCCDSDNNDSLIQIIECDLNYDAPSSFRLGTPLRSSDDDEIVREFEGSGLSEAEEDSFFKDMFSGDN